MFLRLVVFSALTSFPLCAAGVTLSGRVVDENDAPVRAARVSVNSQETQTGPDGAFSLTLPAAGDFLVSVEREGYYALKDRPVHIDTAQELTLVINSVREVFQSENVNAETSPVDVDQSQNQERLTGTEVNDIPYTNSHSLRSSLPLMPGVVLDAGGALHVNGSSENQVLYVLNGFNITNPISGQFQSLLAVEGIRSFDLASGRYSPEFGKGSAGVLNINTENGTDAFHYTATDFIPGVSLQQGLHLGNWYPRFGVSGPIVKGRAWFSDTFDSEYTQSLITGLPSGQDTNHSWAGSNLLHSQINVTPSNILYADFLVNVEDESRVGLGPLNPVSTTSGVRTREYFASIKDQQYFGHGMLVEFGYAHNDFSNVQTPQGESLYVISPTGNSGNYFLDDRQTAARDQGLVHAYLPKFQLAGSHQLEAGVDADRLHYNGDFDRTGYEVLGLSGQLLSETLFPTPARFRVGDAEVSSYLLDTWRVSTRLQFMLGIRQDWDQRIDNVAWSPRTSFSWSPFASGHTRISGGYSITHDAVTLGMLGQPLDQTAYTTEYNSSGVPLEPPAPTTFTIGNAPLVLPRAANWTIGLDHQLAARIFLTAKYLRRRATDEFAFINTLAPEAPPSLLPLPGSDAAGIYQLTNLRRDDYDSVQFTVRQKFSGQYEWMASYTRSRALSNAVLDPNTAEPLQVLPNLVPMPWDAPNRLLAFAYFPLPKNHRLTKNWAISVLADMRSGFPFSVRDQTGIIDGAVDSYRYPLNFDLNIAIERMVTLRGYRFALRGGVDNATNQANPTAVNNVTGAPGFLEFLGDEGRHYVVRTDFSDVPESRRALMRYVVVLLLVTGAAYGQEQYEIGANIGYGFYRDGTIYSAAGTAEAGIRNRFAAGILLGDDFSKYVSAEFRYLYQDGHPFLQAPGVKADIQGQSDALTYELLFHFKTREHRWRPFLAGGAGAKDYIIAGPEPFPQPIPQIASLTSNDVWKVAFSAGGGVKFRLIPHMLLRAEFRDYITTFPRQQIVPAPHNTARGIFEQFTPLFGVSYTFP